MNERMPAEVGRLLEERSGARAERDWAAADALRERIAALGWEVQDGPTGSTARPALPTDPSPTGYARPEDLASLLDEPATVDVSLQVTAEDHPEDLERLLRGLAVHPPPAPMLHELIVVANAPSFDLDALLAAVALPEPPIVLATRERLGWADARNLGLRRSRGAVTVLLDSSLEPTDDVTTPLMAAFDDPAVGVAGGWGVTSEDARHFEDAPPGEVDAIEGYCIAIRREALRTVGGFDRRFRFYRNADLDLSFAIRAAGWRAIRTQPLTFAKHEHRGYTALPDAERDRLSKRNFYRFLDHWGDRRDLLLHPHRHD